MTEKSKRNIVKALLTAGGFMAVACLIASLVLFISLESSYHIAQLLTAVFSVVGAGLYAAGVILNKTYKFKLSVSTGIYIIFLLLISALCTGLYWQKLFPLYIPLLFLFASVIKIGLGVFLLAARIKAKNSVKTDENGLSTQQQLVLYEKFAKSGNIHPKDHRRGF